MSTPDQSDLVRVAAASVVDAEPPRANEVRIVTVPLDAPPVPVAELRSCLTQEEQVRADRYKVESPRRQFVIGRGVLRLILGRYLGIAPREVPITYNANGKPILPEPAAELHFNVSHTDGLAVIALARRPVGIDVEKHRVLENSEGLVRRFFSPAERIAFLELDAKDRPAGVFRGWTCKEAVIKAAGLTVACLDDFDVEIHPARPAALLAARHAVLAADAWQLAAWEPAPGYSAALAVRGESKLHFELGFELR